jgi:ribA/ribD-fused uncharacterized protein
MKTINSFSGEYSWLSNFHPIKVTYQGLEFGSVEAAYQAAKCKNPEDMKKFVPLSPKEAKKLGRTITIREDWWQCKVEIMCKLVVQKFSDPTLKAKLIATDGIELVEGNYWHDNYWGRCTCATCASKEQHNYLGEILMQVRIILIAKEVTK